MTKVPIGKELDRLRDLILDLGWECQRMSSSGVEEYNEICRILDIEEYTETCGRQGRVTINARLKGKFLFFT